MKSIRVPAYAKVNLCLDVVGRRADGYHELRTVFQTITLHDTLLLETKHISGSNSARTSGRTSGGNSSIDLRIIGNSSLAGEAVQDNLVYRAIHELSAELGMKQGVRAVLTKRIPVGRGLGGGSSDAAAALMGVLRLTGKTMEGSRLGKIAAELGADVPYFLHGGRAIGIGRGDEIYPLPDRTRVIILVVSPHNIAVPTRDAYQWLAAQLTKGPDATKLMRFCALCWSPQGGALSNDFEAAVFPRYPRLAAIKRELLRQGAAEASLAGSGSAVFGLFQNPAMARRAARAFPKDQVFVCSSVSRAEYRRKLGGPDLT